MAIHVYIIFGTYTLLVETVILAVTSPLRVKGVFAWGKPFELVGWNALKKFHENGFRHFLTHKLRLCCP